MKTLLPALLLVFLASCSQPPPPTFQPWGAPAQRENATFAAVPADSIPVQAPATNTAPEFSQSVVITNRPIGLIDTNAIAAQRAARIAAQAAEAQPTPTPFPLAGEAQTNAAAPGSPQPATAGGEDSVPPGMIKFPAAPLDQVLQVYSELVNRTVLRAANLASPPITLTTQTALTRREAIQALDAVLAMNGIAMINIGDKFVKAVPMAQANTEGAPTQASNDVLAMPELGQYETHIVQLQNVKPTVMVQTLSSFAKNPAALLAVDDSQILVIRDYTPNIKRMLELIKQIDVPVQSEYTSEVIPIKYAQAKEIADALNSLSSGGGGGVTTVGGSTGGPGRGGFATGQIRPGQGNYGGGGSPFGYSQPGMGGYTPQATVAPVPAPAPANSTFSQRLRDIINQSGGTSAMQILGQTKIIADERSNSLLIFASRQDMDMIKNIVSKLDVVLTQVIIETIIMDVSLDNGWNYSVSAAQEPTVSHNPTTTTAGAMRNNAPFLDFLNAAATNAFALGSLPGAGGFNYWAKIGKSFDLALQAGASDNRVNVIQRPQILTTHAKPGSIFVGSTVPYVTSSSYGGVYGGGNSYQQLRVGIGLTVTPYINPDGLVVMHIDESIDEISGSTHLENVGDVPNTTSRTISADVAVRDGDAIMLGGFIRNASNKTHSGIPILKDIPLLGALFSSQSSSKQRSELIVLMRPTVLHTPEIAATASAEVKNTLPGVVGAEREVQEAEKKALEQMHKETFQHETPVTPEERRAYGQP